MNILLLNAEGHQSVGLQILKDAIRSFWKEATLITLVPTVGSPYRSMAMNPALDLSQTTLPDLEKVESNHYRTDQMSTCDLVDLAFLRQDLFIPSKATWDLVLVGVAPGACTGTDLYRSATTGAALYTATAYRCAAIAFAQEFGPYEQDPKTKAAPAAHLFSTAARILPDYFRTSNHLPGESWVVNFPHQDPQGYRTVPAAHYSRQRMPPTTIIPRARDEKTDATELQKGYVTLVNASLRVNQPLRF